MHVRAVVWEQSQRDPPKSISLEGGVRILQCMQPLAVKLQVIQTLQVKKNRDLKKRNLKHPVLATFLCS